MSKCKLGKKQSAVRWVLINVVMPRLEDLERGMEIATVFEDRHGDKPPMYFARYTHDNSIKISVFTPYDDKTLKGMFKKLGALTVRVDESGAGSWEHCHMFQVAKHLSGKKPEAVIGVTHWLHNMLNYTYVAEAANCATQAADILRRLAVRPNEVRNEDITKSA
jgi:hypothetical protein